MAFGLAETSKLIVDLSLQGNFLSQLGKVNQSLSKTAANLDRTQSRAYRAGQQIGTGIKRGAVIAAAGVGFLASQVAFGVNSLIDLENQTTQTNAVLRSTKGAAGQTSASIRALAEKYESLNATIDDKVIQSGENVLLTFTNIRKNAFEPTLQAALDLSVALHQDLQTSIIQVGKAVNDPATGFGALKRAGVSFSQAQIDLLKSSANLNKEEQKHYLQLRKTNKVAAERYKQGQLTKHQMDAQRVVLAELNKEFGGSFLAGGNTTAGKIAKFGDAIEGLQQSLARALLPAIGNVAEALTALFDDPATIAAADKLGQSIGKLFSKENIDKAIGLVKSVIPILKTAIGVVGALASKALAIWNSLPAPLQKAVIAGFVVNKLTGGLVTNTGGGIFDTLFKGGAQGAAGGIAGAVGRTVLGGVQKVFVVNMPPGGFGGGLPGGTGPGSIVGQFKQALALAGLSGVAGLTIAALTPIALSQLTFALAGGPEGVRQKDVTGRTQTAVARGINPANVPQGTIGRRAGVDLATWAAQQVTKGIDLAERHNAPGQLFTVSERHKDVTNRKTAASFIERTRGSRGDALFNAETKVKTKSGGEVSSQRDIESLRGKIAEGLRTTGKQIDDIARKVNPKLTDLERRVDSSGSLVAGAIAANRASINQSIQIKVDVTASGIHKTVTIQNRYGRATGSAHTDRNGNLGFGGAQ